MTVIASARGARPRSAFVFWAIVALIVAIAAGSLVLRPTTVPPPTAELQAAMEPTAWSPGASKAADLTLTDAPESAGLTGMGDDLALSDRVSADAPATVDDALIVRTGSLELEVENVSAALGAARAEVAALGGYVAGSDEVDQGESRWASVTYRVPVERFAEALAALRDLSDRVVRESTQSAEVTATVVDLDARIANLRASEAALVEIMDRAGRIDDVLSVQARLEVVRGQIEQLEAQRNHLADQAALSTISVSWLTPVAAVTVVQEGWDAASVVDSALAQTVEVLQGLASAAIWLAVVVLPLVGLPLLVLLGLALLLRRRSRVAVAASE
jgi:hypothetical protein